jgi:hypothetical protein
LRKSGRETGSIRGAELNGAADGEVTTRAGVAGELNCENLARKGHVASGVNSMISIAALVHMNASALAARLR